MQLATAVSFELIDVFPVQKCPLDSNYRNTNVKYFSAEISTYDIYTPYVQSSTFLSLEKIRTRQ